MTSTRIAGGGLRYELLHEEGYVFVASPRLLREAPLRRPADAGGAQQCPPREDPDLDART